MVTRSLDNKNMVHVGARRGILNLPGVREDVGVIGIHHDGQFINIVPAGGPLRWDVSPWGRHAMRMFTRTLLHDMVESPDVRTYVAATGMLLRSCNWCSASTSDGDAYMVGSDDV